jgi:hypothetical protein
MVLYSVVSTTRKKFRDLSPAVAIYSLRFENDSFLMLRPWLLLDVRVEVIMPSFSALLS